MRELVRTNDAVVISAIDALLTAAGIEHLIVDQNMSVLEGSIGVFPRRILVIEYELAAARRLLAEAGFAKELRDDAFEGVATSEDAVLGGRLILRQPRRGHRFGHDAILLAAAADASAGEHVVDLGAGVGAAGLALARRVAGLAVTLLEIDPVLANLAKQNAERNGLADRVRAVCLDVAAPGIDFEAAGLAAGSAYGVLMNPPFNAAAHPSPEARRRLAHSAAHDTLRQWTRTASRLLRPDGVLTLIWRADGLGEVFDVLDSGFGAMALLPVHPKPAAPAVRVLVRAVKASRAPLQLLPGLLLADADGKPSEAAEALLRGGAVLPLAEAS